MLIRKSTGPPSSAILGLGPVDDTSLLRRVWSIRRFTISTLDILRCPSVCVCVCAFAWRMVRKLLITKHFSVFIALVWPPSRLFAVFFCAPLSELSVSVAFFTGSPNLCAQTLHSVALATTVHAVFGCKLMRIDMTGPEEHV